MAVPSPELGTRVPCDTEVVVNLTTRVDPTVLRRARIRALEQATSVNAVLRAELERFVGTAHTAL